MSRGYRRILIAIAGMALAAVSHAQPVRDRGGSQTATAKSAQRSAEDANVVASLRRIADALEAQQRDSNAENKDRSERERRDLIAQEDMAYWAEGVFWAALAQAILSLIAIVLVYVTFKEARRAADSGDRMAEEASKATAAAVEASNAGREANEIARQARMDAANAAEEQARLASRSAAAAIESAAAGRESNKIALETAKRQLRAYVAIDRVDFSGITVGERLELRLWIKNFGQTPATVMNWQSQLTGTGRRPSDTTFVLRELDTPPSRGVLGTQQDMHCRIEGAGINTAPVLAEITAGNAIIYLFGVIKYLDVFGDERTTRFRYQLDPANWHWFACSEGNEAT